MRNIITILDLISYTCAIFALVISLLNRKQIGLLISSLKAEEDKKDLAYSLSNITPLPNPIFEAPEPEKVVKKKTKATKAKKKTARSKKKSK